MSNAEQEKVVQPITPEALERREHYIPYQIIDAVNRLLEKYYVNRTGKATVPVEEIVALANQFGLTTGDIYANHWLDFENIYRNAGYEVIYDHPGYNETYKPVFHFKKIS